MSIKHKILNLVAIAVVGLMLPVAYANVSVIDAAKLGKELTPVGAELAGNSAGTIPEWTDQANKTSDTSILYKDTPLFTITGQNYMQYADNLTEGHKALFKKFPATYKMNIYKTDRSAVMPDFVNRNSIKNATQAHLTNDGNGVTKTSAGIPFPIPNNGSEAIWNHLLRYQGKHWQTTKVMNIVSSSGGGLLSKGNEFEVAVFPYYLEDHEGPSYKNKREQATLRFSQVTSPPKLAGAKLVLHEPTDFSASDRKAWRYFPGQRRVRRAPSFAYDVLAEPLDGLSLLDDTDGFFGAPDLYNWKLAGKKEIYIAYNNDGIQTGLADGSIDEEALFEGKHFNTDKVRYELHRVWVVEGNLKEGNRHLYHRRVKYIDEDSWFISAVELYDSDNKLWRHKDVFLKTYRDAQVTYSVARYGHDFISNRYYLKVRLVSFPENLPKAKLFSASSLRKRGVK